jgi:uncharacterized Zn finger protein (UPF0148 family)
MVTIVKHEWHQHDRQYAIELDEGLLSEIYPDLDEDEIAEKLRQIEEGEIDFEEIVADGWENDIDIEWEFQYDDCWTDRKGGYDVTYELGDEDSWVEPQKEPDPTHKCTKCRWTGQSYNTLTQHLREDGTVIEDYYSSEEESHTEKDVCPMCDSDVALTEVGLVEEKARKEREALWAQEEKDAEEEVPCFSCGAMHKESDLPELNGQLFCPDCNEGWVMMDSRDEETDEEADERIMAELEELKRDFDKLKVDREETNTEPPKWPFDRPNEGLDKVEDETLPNYPAGEYTIRIWGRTREIGVSKINKQQYEYWSDEDHEDDLSDALNENYDYDDNDTPKKARFDSPYYEYQDKISFWGFDQDDTVMTIENSEGEEIYRGDIESFLSEAHGGNDSLYDATEEQDELYPHYLGKGYWLYWTQGGKGSCIQTTIVIEEDDEFDPRKLKVLNWDIEGTSVVTRLVYDGVELDDEGMDSEHDNWRGQWSTFSVHHNKK